MEDLDDGFYSIIHAKDLPGRSIKVSGDAGTSALLHFLANRAHQLAFCVDFSVLPVHYVCLAAWYMHI